MIDRTGSWADIRLAVDLSDLPTDRPLAEAMADAVEFDAVDAPSAWHLDATDLGAACRTAGLPLLSIATPTDAAFLTAEKLEDARAALAKAIDHAETAGAGLVHLRPGDGPEDRFLDMLHDATERVAVAGLDLLVVPGGHLTTADAVATLLDDFAAPNLWMGLDLTTGATLAMVERFRDRLGFVRARPGDLADLTAVWSGPIAVRRA